MTRIKWADMEMVGDQSSYVNAVQGELAEVLGIAYTTTHDTK